MRDLNKLYTTLSDQLGARRRRFVLLGANLVAVIAAIALFAWPAPAGASSRPALWGPLLQWETSTVEPTETAEPPTSPSPKPTREARDPTNTPEPPTATATDSPTPAPSLTSTKAPPTHTRTATPAPSATPTERVELTATSAPKASATPSGTRSPTSPPTASPTDRPTASATPASASAMPSPTPAPSESTSGRPQLYIAPIAGALLLAAFFLIRKSIPRGR